MVHEIDVRDDDDDKCTKINESKMKSKLYNVDKAQKESKISGRYFKVKFN